MRMSEIHLSVKDLNKSFHLYERLIEHGAVHWWEDRSAVALVLNDGTAFGLWEEGKVGMFNGKAAKEAHFAFEIFPEELQKYRKLVIESGLKPIDHDWGGGRRSIYFHDFDNHQGEFMTGDWSKYLSD